MTTLALFCSYRSLSYLSPVVLCPTFHQRVVYKNPSVVSPLIRCSFSSTFSDLLGQVCSVLYSRLRPMIIKQPHTDALCQLAHVLRTEVLDEQLTTRGESRGKEERRGEEREEN